MDMAPRYKSLTDSVLGNEPAKKDNEPDTQNTAASIFANAAKSAITEEKVQSARDKYLNDRTAIKTAFVEKVQGVIKALQSLRGVNGERFHIIIDAKHFKEKKALKEDGTYRSPEILIAMAYEKEKPYRFSEDRWLHDAREALCRHGSYRTSGRIATHEVDTSLNGLFLTQADSTVYELGKSETRYVSQPAIGIFIDQENIQTVRCDKKPTQASRPFEDWGWGYNLTHWHRINTPLNDSIAPSYNEISEFITDNCTIKRKQLLTLADKMEQPYKPSVLQRISNKLKFG